ncbi:glycine betaine/proline transport system ATP-binding protein [Nocardioides luteus]|uniref:Glycine betaine/proline ABC transporter, ATP-binding protein n=1 Tax=Nocardioides luteus TaxID=1844 RepID=A0ABQ5T3S1_9ACTN|nr:betaine/proline/choline family ABC transporter ATP-binding protein [Nocardioides luteus]MDR7310409.1 glycine betaine/proline transport system ATP-binding protein [Nocardioides luteus]GGR52927.1 putative glycine betaine/proline ABC transporter (ATP-binding protein) [Nocardioides luteus]GLJ69811.1 putative glycine betaine/proline ABC transporter, ATP-binding protein [Nocardioides luteus]
MSETNPADQPQDHTGEAVPPAIVGRGLSKVYGLSRRQAQRALAADDPRTAAAAAGGYLGAHDIDFEIAKGEMFVVMGLSGSGKSTVLRMINRLNEPSAGELLIDGEDITKVSDQRLREIRNNSIGMVFQHFSLFPHRTVRENAAYGLKVRGVSKSERLEIADTALERVGLGGRGDKLPDELSGGMRQRVGLARALAVDPPILLMDEPFSALDPLIRRDMQDLLVDLQAQDQRTTVFVTHDLNEAMRIGDRVMVMREGRVVQLAPGPEIVAHPADDYVSEFVSDVDRARVLSAGDLLRPARLVLPEDISPRDALRRLGENEVTGAFVTTGDHRLLGVVTDDRLVDLTRRRSKTVREALGDDYHKVKESDVVGDFMHLAGRQVVPVTVVDDDNRLLGVVPRGVILSTLSTVDEEDQEVAHA